jgi:hypothetical protein
MIDEKILSGALRELAERDETGTPPVAGLLRRGHRARLGRTVRTVTVAAAASLLMAGGWAVVAGTGEPAPVPFALAAQTTARTTFHFRLDFTEGPISTAPWHGDYDPVHDRGTWTTEPVGPQGFFVEMRQIGSDCFSRYGPSGSWSWGQRCWPFTTSPETAALGAAGTPGELLAQLKQAGPVTYAGRTGKGRHAVDTYRFTYRIATAPPQWVATKTGTVDIDVTTHRIVKVRYRVDFAPKDGGTYRSPVSTNIVLTLNNFGTPVDVVAPTGARPPTATPGRTGQPS